jgi:hypothetical protein
MAELPDDVKQAIANGNFDELARLTQEGQLAEPTDHTQNSDIKLASGTADECTASDIRDMLDAGGNSGYSGYSGQDGADGASGLNGADGEDGASGYSGAEGVEGASGYSGQDGASGYSGEKGDQGDQGTSGYSGFSGQNNGLPTPPGSDGVYNLSVVDGTATWVSV